MLGICFGARAGELVGRIFLVGGFSYDVSKCAVDNPRECYHSEKGRGSEATRARARERERSERILL